LYDTALGLLSERPPIAVKISHTDRTQAVALQLTRNLGSHRCVNAKPTPPYCKQPSLSTKCFFLKDIRKENKGLGSIFDHIAEMQTVHMTQLENGNDSKKSALRVVLTVASAVGLVTLSV